MATEDEVAERALSEGISQEEAALRFQEEWTRANTLLPVEEPTVTVPPLVNVQLAISRPDVADGEARLVDLEGMLQHQVAADLLRQVADGLHYERPQRWMLGAGQGGAGGDVPGDGTGHHRAYLRQRIAALEVEVRAWRAAADAADIGRQEALREAGQLAEAVARVRKAAETLPGPACTVIFEALDGH